MLANALKDIDLSSISTEIVGVLPIVLPVAITVMAVRKGINFLFGALRGA